MRIDRVTARLNAERDRRDARRDSRDDLEHVRAEGIPKHNRSTGSKIGAQGNLAGRAIHAKNRSEPDLSGPSNGSATIGHGGEHEDPALRDGDAVHWHLKPLRLTVEADPELEPFELRR